MQTHMRVARATDHLEQIINFYRNGLGFEIIGSFEDHDGFDGVWNATDVAGRRIVAPMDIYQLAKRVMTAFAKSAKNANLNISIKNMGFVAFMSMTGHEIEQLFFILCKLYNFI